ncbi:PDDEXK-like family protein [Aliiglaciecola lipolytica]|uniref:PD(D/E)XK endonuclease domain-containing protein n=1 Tax=Aliiglaciecola lipolytica E3 TaxID=1127673 RepID=K6X4E0_9ALTE|nr:hypothetical protein [Aliiglaciecola lipolytica]GAC15489.1 conserved hypothetical protein [Aliiglaciecola lipolytica E3]
MPLKSNIVPEKTKQYCENVSYENQVETWLLKDGWQVFKPHVDHGAKTDVLISDGNLYYRIQVKSVDTCEETVVVVPQWSETDDIDYIIYFSKRAPWGYITPKFGGKRKLKHHEHIRFHQESTNFIKAFNKA